MDLNLKETLRYLGVKGAADERTLALVRRCWGELDAACRPKHIYAFFPVEISENGLIQSAFTVQSSALAKNLKGCGEIALFAATLGTGADRLIQSYSKKDMSVAAVLQASAAAMIEDYCDTCQQSIIEAARPRGLAVRPRFSPGYGDLPLSCQKDIIRILNTPKEIGLTLTETLIMAPSKSVTAVMGLYPASDSAPMPLSEGCSGCALSGCSFQKRLS